MHTGTPDWDGKAERRKKRDRRRKSPQHDNDRLLRLLAMLLSTFAGVLIGLIIAHIISAELVRPFRDLLAKCEAQLKDAGNELEATDPEYTRLLDEVRKWQIRFGEGSSAANGGEKLLSGEGGVASMGDAGPATKQGAGTKDSAAGNSSRALPTPDERQRYEQLRGELESLRRKREAVRRSTDANTMLAADYQREILSYDLSSLAVVLILAIVGYLCYPLFWRMLSRLSVSWEAYFPAGTLRASQVSVGFFAGMILGVLILLAMINVVGGEDSLLGSPLFRFVFGAFVVLTLGVSGSLVALRYFGMPGAGPDRFSALRKLQPPLLLDTSVIIDGRVHDVAATGFLGGVLVATTSVLRELQSMADSADERKRSKGRRGLELLRKMQDDPRLELQVLDDAEFEPASRNTDDHLISTAQGLTGVVVTNDYNLNRVAAIRDVRVININALANAVKTSHLPGDLIEVHILDRGKQRGQGVGYLDDGTMVVVEDGEPYLKQTMVIKLTSVTQTVQGRLIFGRVDAAEEEMSGNSR